MNIAILGDFTSNLDEGFKNTSHYLANALAYNGHQITRLNIKQILSKDFWRGFSDIRPDIIHCNAQPSSQSILFTQMLKLFRRGVPTVLFALRPGAYFRNHQVRRWQKWLLQLAQPDLIFVQDQEAETLFQQAGCTTAYLPNGVDLERFKPVSKEHKRLLRKQYGLDPNRPVALSVGLLVPERNLLALKSLLEIDMQVLVAGSLYNGTNHELIAELKSAGLIVMAGYQPHIHEFYMLADVYVFLPAPGNSIAMPLSVLEAMACNLPVVTTRFRGLLHAFGEGMGPRFIDPGDAINPVVEDVLRTACVNRELVKPYSWQAIANQLENYYQEVLKR